MIKYADKIVYMIMFFLSILTGGIFVYAYFVASSGNIQALIPAFFSFVLAYISLRFLNESKLKYIRIKRKKIKYDNSSKYYAECIVDSKMKNLEFKKQQDYSYACEGFEYVAKIRRNKIYSIERD